MSTELKLTQQQAEAIGQFQKLKVGALFMRPGCGKTRTAVELVNYNHPDYLLYITPHSTISNIQDELNKWGVDCKYDVIGYETLASSDKTYSAYMKKVAELKEAGKKMFIIADESIFIKSGKSKRTRRSKEIRRYFDYALILNGTPIVKNEWDLFNQMDFLSESILQMNSYEFIHKFFVEHAEKRHGRVHRWYTFYEPNRPALTKLCQPYVFQADLEFKHEESEEVSWIICDSNEYESTYEQWSYDYDWGNTDNIVSLFGELQRIAAVAPEKNKEVAEYIEGKPVICFCNYLEEIRQIQKNLNGECYVITGETKTKVRDAQMKDFKEKMDKPMIMTLGVGSFSLNLQFCNEIVYSSISFNYGKMEQSRYRIKRTGQEREVEYTYILGDFGINNMMFANIDGKESLAEIVKRLLQKKDIDEFKEELRKELGA